MFSTISFNCRRLQWWKKVETVPHTLVEIRVCQTSISLLAPSGSLSEAVLGALAWIWIGKARMIAMEARDYTRMQTSQISHSLTTLTLDILIVARN